MKKFYITGGTQRKSTIGVSEWSQYERGCILLVDPTNQQMINQHFYSSPAQYRPDQSNSSVLFKSGSILNDRLYVCTQTEVLIYRLPDFALEYHLSLPSFNDVHHVVPTERDTILVVSTGLDLVQEITPDGELVNEWFTIAQSNWEHFSKSTDYRKVLSTKPHASHPNFVFEYQDAIWVTRFEQKDAICLTDTGQIDIGIERPHDGFVFGNRCYFTTVDGHIVVADLTTGGIVDRYDLHQFETNSSILGWCRGLHVLDEENLIVGFSRIRPTKFHSNLLWLKKQLRNETYDSGRPTRIAQYNLKERAMIWEMDLEPYAMNAVFSVLPA